MTDSHLPASRFHPPHLIYGGDYNPEQWSEDVWLEDARLMREAGVNLVSLGVFAWSKLEPADGAYDFGWLDRVMDLLHAHGVAVNLATPTASPPPWLLHQHPDMHPVTAEGVTLWHGSCRHYCPHNTAYHAAVKRLVTRLAERYAGHPALAMWHIDNEYACHFSACYCDASAAAFRDWLRARYDTLEGFNAAWGTAFWSQQYGDWEEVHPPRKAPSFINPTQQLDWARFCSDSWLACFEEQKAILRQVTPAVPVTTNFMGFFKGIDYWNWAAREDVVSNDSYPDTSEAGWHVAAAMTCDLMRSLGGGRPWVLMEQAPTNVNWRERNATKRPGVMRLGSYQAIARGADGVMFFQWRASQAGAEKWHSGMLPHGGTGTRVWEEIKALGRELGTLDAVLGSRVPAEAAIVFDWHSWWALDLDGKPSAQVRLLPQVLAYYRALHARNLAVDFVHPDAELARYKLLLVPNLYLVTDRAAENLNQYVAQGGTLMMSFFSGMVDTNEHVRLGYYPAPFTEMLGLGVEEYAAYAGGQANALRTVDGQQFGCELWSDVIVLRGAEALAHYVDDYYAGRAALTRHRFGQGTSFYAGTAPDPDGLAWLLAQACEAAGVHAHLSAPAEVEVVERVNGSQRWLFVLNHGRQPQAMQFDGHGVNLLTGAPVHGSVVVEPAGVAVIQFSAD